MYYVAIIRNTVTGKTRKQTVHCWSGREEDANAIALKILGKNESLWNLEREAK